MDAVEFMTTMTRICQSSYCENCILEPICCKTWKERTKVDAEKAMKLVEEWLETHPLKTRQSEFLKMFPNAFTDVNGFPDPDPCKLDRENYRLSRCNCNCEDCRRDYWLQEVE